VAEFMVELYLSREDAGAFGHRTERIRAAAEAVSREGTTTVRFLRRILVPGDETCLLLYESDSIEAVVEAARRADVRFERVTEAVAESNGPDS
jgi:hypothetical protein